MRASMPGARLERVFRRLPVVSDQGGPLLEPLGLEAFEGACGIGMDAPTPVAELRPVGGVVCDRVFERVLDVRVERILVEEVSFDQAPQGVCQVRRGRLGNPLEHAE